MSDDASPERHRQSPGERPLDAAAALREARARGLPDGWTVSIDKRNRRKWTAPNGRSCDSIPKAIAISVELGLLPPDTVVPAGKPKKRKEPAATSPSSPFLPAAGAASHLSALVDAAVGAAAAEAEAGGEDAPAARDGATEAPAAATGTGESAPADPDSRRPAAVPAAGRRPSKKPKVAVAKPASTQPQSRSSCAGSGAASSASRRSKQAGLVGALDDGGDDDSAGGDRRAPPEPMDPETALDPAAHRRAPPRTVHWDPQDCDGRRVGWRVKIQARPAGGAAAAAGPGVSGGGDTGAVWLEGRVARYDPYYHKHKVVFAAAAGDAIGGAAGKGKKPKPLASAWIWLRNQEHNLRLATRIVWAHVKGYAWWPALVIEFNNQAHRRPGSLFVEFFGSDEVAWLKDTPDTIRPFCPDEIDPVVATHKKKRNAKAFDLACQEFDQIRETRNSAVVYYAERAIEFARRVGKQPLVARRVQLHRHDVNYPYGETLTGKVRAYSPTQKRWLVSFEISEKTKTKYDACWINLFGKDVSSLQILSKTNDIMADDIVPFVLGYDAEAPRQSDATRPTQNGLAALLKDNCRGCVEQWGADEIRVCCDNCRGEWHLGCCDPPLSLEAWQKMVKDEVNFVCVRCKPCSGCYQKDIVFGCLPQSKPSNLTFPRDTSFDLCFSCAKSYTDSEYCSNCAHTYDSDKLDKVTKQLEALGRKRKIDSKVCDSEIPLRLGTFVGDDELPPGAAVSPSNYFPETARWGFGEKEMLFCDGCNIWVHAGCVGITEEEYDEISEGEHPVFSREFLCRVCCRGRCTEIIQALLEKDTYMLFTSPVTEREAPNYFDVIKMPMDLEKMKEKAEMDEYVDYCWVRECFELMVLNALTYNLYYTHAWKEAERYYVQCLKTVFKSLGKAAIPSKYASAVADEFQKAKDARKNEEIRVQVDESVEKKDLVAGTDAVIMDLPELRTVPPDQPSCIPFMELKLRPTDAFYCSWMDCCYTCGSSGAMDCFVLCCECGECFHTFCVNAPIHSMNIHGVIAWRCPSCKVCEISGQVPEEETRMLFCEMCDRAFTLDLLDPPLKSVPPGLWICGQCVDCKLCNNTSEPGGTSLTHWSRDPEKCYRCGGCEGLQEECGPCMCCIVCKKFLRSDDTSMLKCVRCDASIHESCCEAAEEVKANKSFLCSLCQPSTASENPDSREDWNVLSEMAWIIVNSEFIATVEDASSVEVHAKLMDALAWYSRENRRQAYEAIVQEALRVLRLSKSVYEDPRILLQQVIGQTRGIPLWIIQRAYRFVLVANRSKWNSEGELNVSIESLVLSAKLAAAFLKVSESMLIVTISDVVLSSPQYASLFTEPDCCGNTTLAVDSIWHGAQMRASSIGHFTVPAIDTEASSRPPPEMSSTYVTIQPLCGWHLDPGTEISLPWKDPRTCFLCGLAGDDDAGVELTGPDASTEANLGRLLPFNGGLFVHSGCALWSSETWEDAQDGLIHGVEKARSRGSQLKCFGCGRYGATVGCSKGNCLLNYHFPCAKACGGAFTEDQHLYCTNHKSAVTNTLLQENHEAMKAVMIAPEGKASGTDKTADDNLDRDLCIRVGTLVVHAIGEIEVNCDGFHSENYITPPGYVATRIFWSTVTPKKRTVYVLKIGRSASNGPLFSIIAGDNASLKISSENVGQAYNSLLEKVRRVNHEYFNTRGALHSRLPVVRRSRRKAHGLNGPQFFGFGLDSIRKKLETAPGSEAVIAPLVASSPCYKFCFVQPSIEVVQDLQRKRAAARAEQALQNSSGCARTEGLQAVKTSGGSGRITRALVRRAEEDVEQSAVSNIGDEAKARVDRNMINVNYKRMKSVPIEQRLVTRRSHIHGWGLFTKMDIAKDQPIVEYMGEIIRQPVADIREKAYEISGEGSCYMFRLDLQRIVDATKTGCMARFMNHSCQPNAYAKIVWVDTDAGQDKKIVVFANRDISSGEEITYDYKFPVEDGSLRCTCGAVNCIGRLN